MEVTRHGSVMEGCHGSVTEVMCHGSVVEKVSWKRLSWKDVMEVVCHGSVMERRRGSDAS